MKYTDVFGVTYELSFKTAEYFNGTTCLQAICEDGEPYARVSVNLNESVLCDKREFYVDVNNCGELVDAMIAEGYLEDMGDVARSGFCTYPLVRMTDKFVEEQL